MLLLKHDIIIRSFEESDIGNKVKWINNPQNNQFLHYDLPLNVEKTLEWFRKKDNTRRLDCIIEYEGVPVGLIGLLQIDRVNLKAEYYITIGENAYKQKGIATKATKAILEYAFTELGLHKVYLTVDARNENAIRLYEKVGFKQEGYFVDDLYNSANSEFIDRKRYSVVKNRGGVKLLYIINNPCFKEKNIKTFFVSPIQKTGEYNGNIIWIKREDLLPFSFGGNKARKAVYFFEDILDGGFDTVVTYGSSCSNHCRVVANACSKYGLKCYIVSPEENYSETFNSLLVKKFGAEIIKSPLDRISKNIDDIMVRLSENCKPYFIEGGGHGNLGTKAYVDAYNEICTYEKANNIYFDYIFHASGTGTTQAGLVCGTALQEDIDRRIVGISIARKNPRGRQVVEQSVADYLKSVDYNGNIPDIIFDDSYICGGYGENNDQILKCIDDVMALEGIPLNRTYSGKAFWGMTEYIKRNNITGKNILFVNTGGAPLFFDDLGDKK